MDAYAHAAFDRPADLAPTPEPVPSPNDGCALRNVLGRFATGVTVVTCASEHGPVGMTVNSFTSLSLSPPLVMWSPAKSSRRYPAFSVAPRFAVHVLGANQRGLSDAFMRAADAFQDTVWYKAPDGLPLIEGCLARFTCERAAEHDAGDHALIIGRVTAMVGGEGDPLLYYRGQYANIG